MTPELNAKIAVWRQRAIDGTLSKEEMREAINLMRMGRLTSATHKASKAKAAPIDSDELLKGLM